MNLDHQRYIEHWRMGNLFLNDLNITVNEIPLIIPPGVFNPSSEVTYSTSILLKYLPEDLKNKSVIDMGSGSGIIGIKSIKNGAQNVLAIDVDKKALRATNQNAALNKCDDKITGIWSDLFQNVIGGKYDFIFANLPILEVDLNELYLRLLSKYEYYLKDDGELWVAYASFGNQEFSEKYFKSHPNCKEKINENKFNVEWNIYKFNKIKKG